jgi:hypothetical protein
MTAPKVFDTYREMFGDTIRCNAIYGQITRLLKCDPRFVREERKKGSNATVLRVKFMP